MFERTLFVKYLPVKDNFIYLPSNLNFLKTATCLRLTYDDQKESCFSVGTVSVDLNENSIGLNSLFAKTLGIKEAVPVVLSELSQLPSVNRITITPANQNDYDVINVLSENIQETLLNQIRVVYIGQSFVIWIGSNINVTVYVDVVEPVSPGVIDFLTEVHINSSTRSDTKKLVDAVQTNNSNKNLMFEEKTMKFYDEFLNKTNIRNNNLNKLIDAKHDLVYRLVSLKNLPFAKNIEKFIKPFNIFVTKKSAVKYWLDSSVLKTPIICSLTLMSNDIFSDKTIYTRLIVFEDILDNFELNQSEHLFVDQKIFELFDCETGSRVIMKHIVTTPLVDTIIVNTNRNYLVNIEEKLKEYLANSSDDVTVLNADVPFCIGDQLYCSLKFVPNEVKFCVVNDDLVRNCKYDIQFGSKVEEKITKREQEDSEIFVDSVSNYQRIIDDTVNADGGLETVLITGNPGTGKSMLIKNISQKLQMYPHYFYVKTMKCKNIKGKTMDSLLKTFSTVFSDLVFHQPSVLFLDDLDVLCENVTGDETAPNAIYFNRISEMLHNFLKLFSHLNRIGICASAESTEKLNKNLYSSRGSHLFKNIFSIADFTKQDRKTILRTFFNDFVLNGVDLEELSIKTEGFVIQDLVDFYNKTTFEVYKDDKCEEDLLIVNQNHCESALKNTCVLSLQNVHLHSPGDSDFSKIGGLHDIKKVLVENLLWPAQYPDIFAKAPLRLQSGLLLYGPPGTGKTLLAAAAAKQCGLRLISVKGPELLSKYIGASEQAVRNIFQKAQSVRPCILFFDEFDSLAPRRGHDNTGVTDRVVNQLLTQLDGVESLTGVCVLAATSRPDLLDPALLRPGRLDKQLLCPLPDQGSRMEILTILSKNLDLDSDVNLEEIAMSTEFFSGADLQSLMYTAQLASVDHLLDIEKFSSDKLESKVTQNHLLGALAKTKPSLPPQERRKYERIYAKFQIGSTVEDFKTARATLA